MIARPLTKPGISIEDIATLGENFWKFYLDGECALARTYCIEATI